MYYVIWLICKVHGGRAAETERLVVRDSGRRAGGKCRDCKAFLFRVVKCYKCYKTQPWYWLCNPVTLLQT